jgi:hypothetical protein
MREGFQKIPESTFTKAAVHQASVQDAFDRARKLLFSDAAKATVELTLALTRLEEAESWAARHIKILYGIPAGAVFVVAEENAGKTR